MTPSSSTDELGYIFGRTKGYLLTEQTAHSAVDALAEVARDVVVSARGAGVSLITPDGRRTSIGATDDAVRNADTLQYELQEGPCLTAWATQELVVVNDSRTDTRWGRWAREAAGTGVLSCMSVPLLKGPTAIGAMKVYSSTADAFTEADERMLVLLAKSAAALLGHIQSSDTPRRISEELKTSLKNRDALSIARGILMERHQVDEHAALTRLILLAKERGITLRSMAGFLIDEAEPTGSIGSP